jgi:polyketide biosynthesis enoyl-CoA hydratase PksH
MTYETLLADYRDGMLTIAFNRPQHNNSINSTLLAELNRALDRAEEDPDCKLVILKGCNGYFCTGMDFQEASETAEQAAGDLDAAVDPKGKQENMARYLNTIKRLTLIPKTVISVVEGQAMAGGIGLVAASDLVVATPDSQFSLSEAIWGLLPSMVMPFLIRRTGFQPAYRMTLTTLPVLAEEALSIRLVDAVSQQPDQEIRRWWLRISRLSGSTIGNLKHYFRKMWMITEEMEQLAIAETARLSADPQVVQNITNFVKYKKFPWDD